MKNKKHNKNIIFALIFLIMVITLINYKTQAEIKFEDVFFKKILENITSGATPYEAHFSIINPQHNSANCTITLVLVQNGTINETKYNVGEIPKRTKLKYKIPFNMPEGNNTINIINNCAIY